MAGTLVLVMRVDHVMRREKMEHLAPMDGISNRGRLGGKQNDGENGTMAYSINSSYVTDMLKTKEKKRWNSIAKGFRCIQTAAAQT